MRYRSGVTIDDQARTETVAGRRATRIVPIVVASVSLLLLFYVVSWWVIDGCRSALLSTECLIPARPERFETLVALAGVVSGGGFVWMGVAAWRQRKLQAGLALVAAVSALGIGRWWVGPLSPLDDARFTSHHLILLFIAGGTGAIWAAVGGAWSRSRTGSWTLAALTTVMATGLALLSTIYGASYVE